MYLGSIVARYVNVFTDTINIYIAIRHRLNETLVIIVLNIYTKLSLIP